MMTIEQLCRHIIHLIHTPIRVYDPEGNQTAVYVDNGEQQDVITCDHTLLQTLLKKRNPNYPVLHLEAQQIIYGIISNESETYLFGPCCLRYDEISAAKYLIK